MRPRTRPRVPRPIAAAAILPVLVSAPAALAAGGGAGPGVSPPPAKAPATAGTEVYVQGDSLTVGMAADLRHLLARRRVRISARVGRTLVTGLSILRPRARRLPGTVVIGLGTNDDANRPAAFRAEVAEVLRLTGSRRCVLWIDLYQRPARGRAMPFAALNRVLLSLRARHPNLVLVRWSQLAARNPAWFRYDSVHPTDAGYAARARQVVRGLAGCAAPAAPRSTSPAPAGTGTGGGAAPGG